MRADPAWGFGTPLAAWQASSHLAQVPTLDAAEMVHPGQRAVIVAPHPDDEVLGCGGLIQQLAQLGRACQVIAVTDGEASHPGSRAWPPSHLARVRPEESREALQRLVPDRDIPCLRAGLPDGGIAAGEQALADWLGQRLRADDVVFTTWRGDGHPDHEACGRATLAAAQAVGCHVCEYPVWAWHWATPDDPRLPWERARRLPLAPSQRARKQRAVAAFASQLDASPDGHGPILDDAALARLLQPFELVFI
ncbi:PIG-L deacetylase family protein [Metapseudomonas otitidis]|uniref:PIG-L deacetylase family protein n=1 Tax=Metapseudomonas otitidis TaxID=319939 RepID=UPI001CA4006A|nr:PIG-L family deacetylase [Pseudomonas otitidis]QZX80604.1 PIG-L family deacetylase [Pseudomonas otitidis]